MKIPFVSARNPNLTCGAAIAYSLHPGLCVENNHFNDQGVWVDWAAGQNYVVGDSRDVGLYGYTCIANHLSAADNRPESGTNWHNFWFPHNSLGWYMPCAGAFSHLLLELPAALGVGSTLTVVLRKNEEEAALRATLGAADTQASDLINSVSFAAGDRVSMRHRGTGAGVLYSIRSAMIFEPTTPGQIPFFGDCYPSNNTMYSSLAGGYSTTEEKVQTVVPVPGKFKFFYADSVIALAAGSPATLTLRVNGVDSALVLAWPGGEAIGSQLKTDLATEVVVAAGDLVSFAGVTAPGSILMQHSICFIPDDPRFWWIPRSCGEGNMTNGALKYGTPSLGLNEVVDYWEAAETTTPFPAGVTVTGIALKLKGAPGAGAGRTVKLRRNSVDVIALTVSDLATFGVINTSLIEPADYDGLSISEERVGLPAANRGAVAILGATSTVTVTAVVPNSAERGTP